ncbi:hypothetical protein HanRHA438_Chr11g0493881 [Helianthus annuus]|nr:hypothetical protein HanRHA438_Chr11g0493881 [Helianthus annuus]
MTVFCDMILITKFDTNTMDKYIAKYFKSGCQRVATYRLLHLM